MRDKSRRRGEVEARACRSRGTQQSQHVDAASASWGGEDGETWLVARGCIGSNGIHTCRRCELNEGGAEGETDRESRTRDDRNEEGKNDRAAEESESDGGQTERETHSDR